MSEQLFSNLKDEIEEKGIKMNPYIRQILEKRHELDYLPQIYELLIKFIKSRK